AVLVIAPVAQGRQKFVQQVSVGRVDFRDPEARRQRPLGGLPERIDDGLHIPLRHRLGHWTVGEEGHRAWADDVPAALLRRYGASALPRPIRSEEPTSEL